MVIFRVILVTVLVLLKLVSGSDVINKTEYFQSLTPQERLEIFNVNDVDHIPEFEVIDVNFPRLKKRSLDNYIPFTLPLQNRNVNLNLRLAASIIGPNTPVYTFKTRNGRVHGSKTTPFTDYTSKIYEDEAQLASLILDVDENGNRFIRSGIIEAQNISIHRAPNHQNPQMQNPVIVRFLNLVVNGARSLLAPSTYQPAYLQVTIPDVIYPEILLLIDSAMYSQYSNFDAFKNYILNFWTAVNSKYKSLSNPQYKLSIAGIAVAEDSSAFSFIPENHKQLNFEQALTGLQEWLYNIQNTIPIESYDMAITHTQLPALRKINIFPLMSYMTGLASKSTACLRPQGGQVIKAGIIYDDNNYNYIYTAAHELAHILGVDHDDNVGCTPKRYIMSAVSPENAHLKELTWSQCSINGFHQFLRTNPQCLFNVPESYQQRSQPTPPRLPPNVDDNNHINPDSVDRREDDFDDYQDTNTNNRGGTSLPVIPSQKFNQFITGTNTRYSDLNRIQYQRISLEDNLSELSLDLQEIPHDKIMYIQIVDKKDLFVYYLEKATWDTSLLKTNSQRDHTGLSIRRNDERRTSLSWRSNVTPASNVAPPSNINVNYDNGGIQTRFVWKF